MLHKKLLSCGLAAMLCLFSAAAFAAEPTANITVNGQELILEDLPVFENDRILVPMRAIFEALDTFVGWDSDTQTISAQNGTSFLLFVMIISIILMRTPVPLRSKTLGLYATATYAIESGCVLGLAACLSWAGLQNTLLFVSAVFMGLTFLSVCARKREDFWQVLSSEKKISLQNKKDLL